jgi:hypothetical protein
MNPLNIYIVFGVHLCLLNAVCLYSANCWNAISLYEVGAC